MFNHINRTFHENLKKSRKGVPINVSSRSTKLGKHGHHYHCLTLQGDLSICLIGVLVATNDHLICVGNMSQVLYLQNDTALKKSSIITKG